MIAPATVPQLMMQERIHQRPGNGLATHREVAQQQLAGDEGDDDGNG